MILEECRDRGEQDVDAFFGCEAGYAADPWGSGEIDRGKPLNLEVSEIDAVGNNPVLTGRADAEGGHLAGRAGAYGCQSVRLLRGDSLTGYEEPAPEGALYQFVGFAVIGVDDHGRAGEPSGEPAQYTRFGDVGMNDVISTCSDMARYRQEGSQVAPWVWRSL